MFSHTLISDLRRASRQLARELGTVGSHHPTVNCSVTEGHVLVELDLAVELCLLDIAEALALDKSTTSRAVASLVKQGLVDQRGDHRDRRRKLFSLTESGRRMVGDIHKQANRRVNDALSLLSPESRKSVLEAVDLYARALGRSRRAQQFEIRSIEAKDNRALSALIAEIRNEHRPIIGKDAPTLEPHELDLFTYYQQTNGVFLVIHREGILYGGGGIAPLSGSGKICELQRMYFKPDIRGLGLGFRLLNQLLHEAGKRGYQQCYAETMAGMDRANALYIKAGFKSLNQPMGNTGHCFTDAWFLLDLFDAS